MTCLCDNIERFESIYNEWYLAILHYDLCVTPAIQAVTEMQIRATPNTSLASSQFYIHSMHGLVHCIKL